MLSLSIVQIVALFCNLNTSIKSRFYNKQMSFKKNKKKIKETKNNIACVFLAADIMIEYSEHVGWTPGGKSVIESQCMWNFTHHVCVIVE